MTVRDLVKALAALPEALQDRPAVFMEPYDTDPATFEIASVSPSEDETQVILA